ncbi:MAG: PAS domain-containing protein [Dehalococcoidia bacterium]|nr:PAS domain-containing protein [Dehalococcoidia bacterium]
MNQPAAGALLPALLDRGAYIVLAVDTATGRIVECNAGAAAALGYTCEELRTLNIFAVDAGLSRDIFARHSAARGAHSPLETCYRRKDGSTFPVEVNVDSVTAGDGSQYCLAIARDVTGQRTVERQLDETRRRNEFLVRNMPGAVYSATLANGGRLTWLDRRIAEMTGYPEAELLALDGGMRSLVLPDDLPAFDAIRRTPPGQPFDHQYRVTRKDGQVRILRDTGRVAEGDRSLADGMLFDVTERVERERILREAWEAEHERFQLVVRASRQITHEWTAATMAINWGGSLRDVLGYTREAHGETFEDWFSRVHPDDRAQVKARRKRAGDDQLTVLDFEYRYLHADGTYRWIWDHCAFEWGPNQKLLRVIGVMQDVTARKQLEAQVHSAQRMETIGALAGGVAHDVNNYLTTILGNIDLARMRVGPGERWDELEDARAAVQGCAELVRSLLTFARQRQPARSLLHADEVVAHAGRILQRLVGPGIEITHCAEPGLTLFADPVQVQQVLMNLVVNARDVLGEDGRIDIRAESATRVDPVAGAPREYARLTVTDTGPGVPNSLLDRIFEPYFSSRPLGEGTGLGLSIVHGISRAHGGWVEVENAPSGGAAFSVYLPVN